MFVVAFAEHALFVGTFVPGEVILPLTGVAAATTGVVAWPAAAACATAGGFLADQLTYWLARWLVRRRGDRPATPAPAASPARPRSCASCTAATAPSPWSWGGSWPGWRRSSPPAPAGPGMPYRRFLPANALANALWGPVMVGVGYLFGVQAARLEGPWRWAGLALTGGDPGPGLLAAAGDRGRAGPHGRPGRRT